MVENVDRIRGEPRGYCGGKKNNLITEESLFWEITGGVHNLGANFFRGISL